jgi:hypothetical protein
MQTFDPPSIIWLVVAITLRIVMDERVLPWIPQTRGEHMTLVMLLVIDGSGGSSARVESRLWLMRKSMMTVGGESERVSLSRRQPGGHALLSDGGGFGGGVPPVIP